jgi:dGTPase
MQIMLIRRQDQEQIEERTLAPYALKSAHSQGRQYPESEPQYRTAFQRDRDRIVHTTAFRRLEYKTQVFVNYEGDYYRTRLTHTLEVAQVGRSLARALGANEDLVEAICLGHDLGHPPFGHAGESILNKLMAGHGGFEHNKQSFRILTELERRFPKFPGLNLTYETREGLIKHETEYDQADAKDFAPDLRASLEAQIANVADELAYNVHDLDDGLRADLLHPDQLRGLGLWEQITEQVGWRDNTLTELNRHHIIRELIGLLVEDVLEHTNQQLEAQGIQSPLDVQQLSQNIVGHSPHLSVLIREWKDFLYQNLYRHHRVVRMSTKAERFLKGLFDDYIREPKQLPPNTQQRIEVVGLHRAVTDYLAGMTDRYALQEWQRLYDPFVRP